MNRFDVLSICPIALSLFYFFKGGVDGMIFAMINNANPTITSYTGILLGCNAIGCMLFHSPNAPKINHIADMI